MCNKCYDTTEIEDDLFDDTRADVNVRVTSGQELMVDGETYTAGEALGLAAILLEAVGHAVK